MDDLTAFVSARLDEDDYWANIDGGNLRRQREVAAKRAILAEHATRNWKIDDGVHDCQWATWPCRTLRLLAAVWNDHPDYRQEWAP